jgi:hypothetical protein
MKTTASSPDPGGLVTQFFDQLRAGDPDAAEALWMWFFPRLVALAKMGANRPNDEFIANCAIWQLSLIRPRSELQLQLEPLRSRAKSQ